MDELDLSNRREMSEDILHDASDVHSLLSRCHEDDPRKLRWSETK
jgi:hypothetical protein